MNSGVLPIGKVESLVAKNVTTVQKLSRTNQTHNIPPPLLGSLAGRNSTFSLSRALTALMLNADVDLVESHDDKTKFSELEDGCKPLVEGEVNDLSKLQKSQGGSAVAGVCLNEEQNVNIRVSQVDFGARWSDLSTLGRFAQGELLASAWSLVESSHTDYDDVR